MKKTLIFIFFILLGGCASNEVSIPNNKPKEDVPIVESYKDENPVKISLYVDNAIGGLSLVGEEFKDTWQLKRDIVILSSIFSQNEDIAPDYFQDMWLNAAKEYENYQNYKTGWYIYFELSDGTIIEKNVLAPTDVEEFYEYLEIYLYDSVNQVKGAWYSHLTVDDMKENTILTTMKLTAGSKYQEIITPITIKVFTYDGNEDFDDNGFYRGNSVYTTKVYND